MDRLSNSENRLIQRCCTSENWWGSSFDLSMAYKLSLTTQERLLLLRTLWSHPSLRGVADSPEHFGLQWHGPDETSVSAGKRCYGYIAIGGKASTGCLSMFLEDAEMLWLCLSIPLAMLEPIFPVTYPLLSTNARWIQQVERTLLAIGETMYHYHAFEIAAISEEASMTTLVEVKREIRKSSQGYLIGEPLFHNLGIAPYGTRLSEGLWWTGSRYGLGQRGNVHGK